SGVCRFLVFVMMRPVFLPAAASIKTTHTTTGPTSRGQPIRIPRSDFNFGNANVAQRDHELMDGVIDSSENRAEWGFGVSHSASQI
ncbi:hypothetical protein DN546_35755, partial [Burkholderia multivorans]